MKEKENSETEKILQEYVKNEERTINDISKVGPEITIVPDTHLPWQKERPLGNQIGWIPLPVLDLPTRGLFYPQDTVVAIRAANGAEIRHWSTLQEDDLSALDDMLNYVIERCVTMKSGNTETGAYLSWKDIKEVDRFYLLLAIQELTFANGENKLQVKISETKKLDVKKDMINYISLDPKLMQYYDEEERCFVLKMKSGKILKVDLPSVGTTQWIKNYMFKKQRTQEYIDEDYLAYAPFVIRNWRGLNDDVYNKYVEDSQKWDTMTISVLAYVKKLFSDAINPAIKFNDEGGTEHSAPLNFQGGIKSFFLISDPFGQLE